MLKSFIKLVMDTSFFIGTHVNQNITFKLFDRMFPNCLWGKALNMFMNKIVNFQLTVCISCNVSSTLIEKHFTVLVKFSLFAYFHSSWTTPLRRREWVGSCHILLVSTSSSPHGYQLCRFRFFPINGVFIQI